MTQYAKTRMIWQNTNENLEQRNIKQKHGGIQAEIHGEHDMTT